MKIHLGLKVGFSTFFTVFWANLKFSIAILLTFLMASIALAKHLEDSTTSVQIDSHNQHKTEDNAEKNPDKELLLFLSEFSDSQGDWIDPEVFNQPNTETNITTLELEETKNEKLPNNI